MLPRPRVGPWPIHERRTVVAAVLALAGAILSLLDWSQLVVPIQQSFAAGAASELLLRQVPDIAGLLALPLIGVLAARNPPHRMLLFAGILLLAGGTTMAVAPTIEIFVPGLALLSVGRVVVLAVAVATVAEVVQDDLRRASAFATLGMIAPALEIGAPLGVAWLLGNHGWRAVGSVWAIAALLVLLSSRLADRRASGPPPAARRPWAPLMMGVALVGVVQWLSAIAHHGVLSTNALAWLSIAVVAGGLWRLLVRRLGESESVDRVLRAPGLLPMLVVQLLGQCTNLWFFVFVIDRYVLGETPLHAAAIAVPAQLAGLVGARAVGWLSPRAGLRLTGTLFLGLQAVSFLASCVQTVDLSIWITASILAAYGFFSTGSFVCLARGVMDCAPPGTEQPVSSYRTMAGNIGSALGTLVINVALVTAMTGSMRARAEADGEAPEVTQVLVQAVRDNVPNLVVAERLDLDEAALADLRALRKEVIVDGFRAQSIACAIVIAIAAVGFWLARRDPPRVVVAASSKVKTG